MFKVNVLFLKQFDDDKYEIQCPPPHYIQLRTQMIYLLGSTLEALSNPPHGCAAYFPKGQNNLSHLN